MFISPVIGDLLFDGYVNGTKMPLKQLVLVPFQGHFRCKTRIKNYVALSIRL